MLHPMPTRRLNAIGRTYRHVQRYRQILGMLLRYGYGDLLDKLHLDRILRRGLSASGDGELGSLSSSERLRMLLEDLGPTFIKAGQLLSTRPDLVPVALLHELARLQDSVPPFAFEEVRDIVEAELQLSLEKAFESFEQQPLAAASIGQVHAATTVTGEAVVVKVQRPKVRRMVEVDLEIMHELAQLAERHLEGWQIHQPTRVVDELSVSLERELDYLQEAAHLERFAWQFRSDPRVKVPSVYRALTTDRVLVMERIEGVKVSDSAALLELRYQSSSQSSPHSSSQYSLQSSEVAARIAELTMEQLFVHGFFHGDPHPGNLLVQADGVVCYLDFGLMGRLDRSSRESFAELVAGIVQRDETEVADALLGLCRVDEAPDEVALQRDVMALTDRHFYQPLKEMQIGEALQQLLEVVARHRLTIPADVFLTIKALTNVEGLCRSLDPEFEIVSQAAPFIRRIHLNRWLPSRLMSDLFEASAETLEAAHELPLLSRDILRQLRSGKARAGIELLGLGRLTLTYDRISNRLAFALVLAALIVGSSIVVLAKTPPLVYDISLFGIVGFVFAALMGFWLLISILRHGRM